MLTGEEVERERRTLQAANMCGSLPDPCVYCGPSIKGVARQYAIYQGGEIPGPLAEIIRGYPDARKLLVSTEAFPDMRKQLDTPETPEAGLYKAFRRALDHGHSV